MVFARRSLNRCFVERYLKPKLPLDLVDIIMQFAYRTYSGRRGTFV